MLKRLSNNQSINMNEYSYYLKVTDSIQHHEIKFVSGLQQVGGFLWLLWFPPPIKLATMI